MSNAGILKQSTFELTLVCLLYLVLYYLNICHVLIIHTRLIYLRLLLFPSEMHQEHSCLLCRKALQCHAGTRVVSLRILFVIITNKLFSVLTSWSGNRGANFPAAVNKVPHCDVLTGSRDQGHNPHPYNGVPL